MEGVSHDAVVGVSLDAGVGVGVDARVREHGLVSDQALSSAFLVVGRGGDRFSFQDFVLMENGLFTLVVGVVWMFFYLGSWGRVDVVEESLEIVAGKRTVHLLVRPCIGFR